MSKFFWHLLTFLLLVLLFAPPSRADLPQPTVELSPGIVTKPNATELTITNLAPNSTIFYDELAGPFGERLHIQLGTSNAQGSFSATITTHVTTPGHYRWLAYSEDGHGHKNSLTSNSVQFWLTDGSPVGEIDSFDSNQIIGWAVDPDNLNGPVRIQIEIDNFLFGFYPAHYSRADINDRYGIPGDHGFIIPMPFIVQNQKSHAFKLTIENRGQGHATLLDNRQQVINGPPAPIPNTSNPHLRHYGYANINGDSSTLIELENVMGDSYDSCMVYNFENLIQDVTYLHHQGKKAIIPIDFLFIENDPSLSDPSGPVVGINDYDLLTNYAASWNEFVVQHQSVLNSDMIFTFLIDEPYWNGLTNKELRQMVNTVKNSLPDIPITIVEAYCMLEKVVFPTNTDYIAFDLYYLPQPDKDPMFLKCIELMQNKKSHPSQQFALITDAFWSARHEQAGIQPKDMANIAYRYYHLGQKLPGTIGLFNFTWDMSSTLDWLSVKTLPTEVAAAHRFIGKEILTAAQPSKTITAKPTATMTVTLAANATSTVTPSLSPTSPSQTCTPSATTTVTPVATAVGPDQHTVQGYPNPASEQVLFKLGQDNLAQVRIDIYNLTGDKIASLQQSYPGQTIQWSVQDVAPGIYFYRTVYQEANRTYQLPLSKIAIIH